MAWKNIHLRGRLPDKLVLSISIGSYRQNSVALFTRWCILLQKEKGFIGILHILASTQCCIESGVRKGVLCCYMQNRGANVCACEIKCRGREGIRCRAASRSNGWAWHCLDAMRELGNVWAGCARALFGLRKNAWDFHISKRLRVI